MVYLPASVILVSGRGDISPQLQIKYAMLTYAESFFSTILVEYGEGSDSHLEVRREVWVVAVSILTLGTATMMAFAAWSRFEARRGT